MTEEQKRRIALFQSILGLLRTMRDQETNWGNRHRYNEVCDRLDLLINELHALYEKD